jgi:hypothetical protein
MFAFGSQVRSAEADVTDVDIVEATFFNSDDDCDETYWQDGLDTDEDDPFILDVEDELALCISTDSNELGSVVSADSDGIGEFTAAYCGDNDNDGDDFDLPGDRCEVVNLGNDHVDIACGDDDDSNPALNNCDSNTDEFDDIGDILLFWECEEDAGLTRIRISQTDGDQIVQNVVDVWVFCAGQPDDVTVTAKPTTVEIVPQIGSYAHSEITVTISGDELPIEISTTEIDVSVPKCAIEIGNDDPDTTPLADSTFDDAEENEMNEDETAIAVTNAAGTATIVDNIWFHADWNNCTPGDVIVTVTVEVDDGADITKQVTIKVVGPPAFITATAAPDRLICGEKSTITVKVTDAIGQNVSNNTQVELISNWGSVIAGTGATLGFPGTGPVNPLASSAAATYNGVAIAYLLTSNNHVGVYEVVAAAGGTLAFPSPYAPAGDINDPYYTGFTGNIHDHNDSLYTGAPITTQVSVTCSLPAAPVAPTVTNPNTGTGSITPPNTGDAGLASSSSNAMLFVLVGAVAFVLAGVASVSYARKYGEATVRSL